MGSPAATATATGNAPATGRRRARLPHPGARGREALPASCSPRVKAACREHRGPHAAVRPRAAARAGGGAAGQGARAWIRTPIWWRKSRRCSGRAVYSWSMPDELEFEKPLLELENRIAELRASEEPLEARDEIAKLEERLARQQQRVYAGLTAWQRAQIARHPKRPHTLDLVNLLLEDWVELHGDRVFGDDKAIVGGLATLRRRAGGGDRPPEGPRHPREHRAQLRHAASRGLSQGAPAHAARGQVRQADHHASSTRRAPTRGSGAEERGQAEAIARNLREMAGLPTPIICVVTGEGGSGGALAHRGRQPRAHARVRDLLGDLARGLRGHPVGRRAPRRPRPPS